MVFMFLSFSAVQLIVTINTFTPNPSLPANESQTSGFSVKISSRSALAGGSELTAGCRTFSK
jgi:hypothetical protein